ncbi:hypothetical protein C8F01DRAFT_1160758 [Mycena amicta]|nr:hypothetical protein C8F01DRAFT_1160758 [Mycena amicta]
MWDTLAPPIRMRLNTRDPLDKVERLFDHLDAQSGNAPLIRAFQHAVSKRGGMDHMLSPQLQEETRVQLQDQRVATGDHVQSQSQKSGSSSSPNNILLLQDQPLAGRPLVHGWFSDTFKEAFSRPYIESALAGNIVDVIQDMPDTLLLPIRESLDHAESSFEQGQVLFRHLDAQSGNVVLVHAFQQAMSRWAGGNSYMLNPLPREETSVPLQDQQWFLDTFKKSFSRSYIEGALAGNIVDVIQDMPDILLLPIRESLDHAESAFEQGQILFRHLDAQSGNVELVRAFQQAVSRWAGGNYYMLNPLLSVTLQG